MQSFEAWLRTLPALGYPPDWVQRNVTRLRERFEADSSPMPPCPPSPASQRSKSRYDEL